MHHAHLFASDIDASLNFYEKWFDAKVGWDGMLANARNVFVQIGGGHIHFYDQPPKGKGPSAAHHWGINRDDISGLVAHLEGKGYTFRSPIRNFGNLKYIMREGPDKMLIEVFENRGKQTGDCECRTN